MIRQIHQNLNEPQILMENLEVPVVKEKKVKILEPEVKKIDKKDKVFVEDEE